MRVVTTRFHFALLLGSMLLATVARAEDVPEDVMMLLPRGGIPAVFEPEFVPADEADIDDDAWVLGVVINGEAHAYSLNLLNHHEVVNDNFGGLPVAAVW
jgi:carotenoid cleavage dioxygenase-like enzyme